MIASAPAAAPRVVESIVARARVEPLVLDGVLPELCPALEQIILRRSQMGRSTKSLNVGGWKSAEDFFLWPDTAVQQLRQWIITQVELRAAKLVGWAMINRAGSHHPRHQHRVATLTGVYYVTPGSEDAITPTIFECKAGNLEVEPHPGRLVICRGETWHFVPLYPGEQPRITIAFDVRR